MQLSLFCPTIPLVHTTMQVVTKKDKQLSMVSGYILQLPSHVSNVITAYVKLVIIVRIAEGIWRWAADTGEL